MSLNFIHGKTIHLEDNGTGNFIEVKSEKERHDYSEEVHNCTSNAQSVTYHIPVNIEADTNIDGNLVVSGSLTSSTPAIDNNRLVLNTDLNSIADSTLLPIKDINSAPMAGWYINNAGAGDKANYYFYGKTSPEVHTLDELKYIYALCDIRAGGNLYLNVYTERQNDGNDAGAWYRSRLNYLIEGSGSTATTGLALLKANLGEEPSDIFDSVQRVDCTLDPFSSNGPQAGSENILTISVQSDSGAGAGTIEYVIQNVGFKLEHVIQNFMLTTDNFSSEADIRTIVESYGYQDEAMVNALIASALAAGPYETTAQIDARGYKTEGEIQSIVESYNYQTEGDVNGLISTALTDYETSAEIDTRGYLTQAEIEDLISGHFFFSYINQPLTSINGQDPNVFFNSSINLQVEEGGAHFDNVTGLYTLPEAGNYKLTSTLAKETKTHEFQLIVQQLDNTGTTVEREYHLQHDDSNKNASCSVILPNKPAHKKLRMKVYNPSALGQNVVGRIQNVEVDATNTPGAYPQFGGIYVRKEVAIARNSSPPRQFIVDPNPAQAGLYRYDDTGAGVSYILYKLDNQHWYISNHTTATLDANLSANSNNWFAIGDLLTAPNGYLGQNLLVSQTQSTISSDGYYGPGVGAGSWATGSFSDPYDTTEQLHTSLAIYKI